MEISFLKNLFFENFFLGGVSQNHSFNKNLGDIVLFLDLALMC